MTDIEVIRELHCYKMMYNILQVTITECIQTGQDLVVREKLMKAQQEAEDIYTGEIYEYKTLTADERVIVELLSYIMDTEIDRGTDADMDVVDDCVKWSLAIQNKKVELSEEFIDEQIKKFFAVADIEKDSEQ